MVAQISPGDQPGTVALCAIVSALAQVGNIVEHDRVNLAPDPEVAS